MRDLKIRRLCKPLVANYSLVFNSRLDQRLGAHSFSDRDRIASAETAFDKALSTKESPLKESPLFEMATVL